MTHVSSSLLGYVAQTPEREDFDGFFVPDNQTADAVGAIAADALSLAETSSPVSVESPAFGARELTDFTGEEGPTALAVDALATTALSSATVERPISLEAPSSSAYVTAEAPSNPIADMVSLETTSSPVLVRSPIALEARSSSAHVTEEASGHSTPVGSDPEPVAGRALVGLEDQRLTARSALEEEASRDAMQLVIEAHHRDTVAFSQAMQNARARIEELEQQLAQRQIAGRALVGFEDEWLTTRSDLEREASSTLMGLTIQAHHEEKATSSRKIQSAQARITDLERELAQQRRLVTSSARDLELARVRMDAMRQEVSTAERGFKEFVREQKKTAPSKGSSSSAAHAEGITGVATYGQQLLAALVREVRN